MKIKRGLFPYACVALLGLSLSGCGGGSEPPAAPDLKAVLAAAVAELGKGDYAYTIATPETNGLGVVHLPSKTAAVDVTSNFANGDTEMELELRTAGQERWTKVTMDLFSARRMGVMDEIENLERKKAGLPLKVNPFAKLFDGKRWLHVNPATLGRWKIAGLNLSVDDPAKITGASLLINAAITAEGDRSAISGVIDATKITESAGIVDTATIGDMESPTDLPYRATLDGQGRLTELQVTALRSDAIPGGEWTLTFSGYGAQKPTAKPSGRTGELPLYGYGLLISRAEPEAPPA